MANLRDPSIDPVDSSGQPRGIGQAERRKVHSVTELTARIKSILEEKFPFIWIQGEISNLRVPASGHLYFTLKDSKAQIAAVMFRSQGRQLRLSPEDGMSIIGFGRVSVFEPRGSYQIILEYMEPAGVGALQLAFERLKNRLAEEGYFDARHKKPIPYLPRKISVVTSPTGAVVHDIINIVSRRFPGVHLEIAPVRVQGAGAEHEIAAAIEWINARADSDLIILARGGGSLEDLQAFNSETLAMAVFGSRLPVISAVGHETDFTIADFIADLRAPTPSAAAELAVPDRQELLRGHQARRAGLQAAIRRRIEYKRNNLQNLQKRLSDPRRSLRLWRQRVGDLTARLVRLARIGQNRERQRLDWWVERLNAVSPAARLEQNKKAVEQNRDKLLLLINLYLQKRRMAIDAVSARLNALSPLGVLRRGYSITRTLPGRRVVLDPEDVALRQAVEVRVAEGTLVCTVEGKSRHGQQEDL
jgi:exodeoxyribonuclease VII large subunit